MQDEVVSACFLPVYIVVLQFTRDKWQNLACLKTDIAQSDTDWDQEFISFIASIHHTETRSLLSQSVGA